MTNLNNKTSNPRNPDFQGIGGRAWRIDLHAVRQRENVSEDDDGTRGVWVIHAPQSHPMWPWYRLIMFHLRPHPNFKEPAIIYKPGATHEFVLQALNPDHYPPAVDDVPHHYLIPSNFAAQFVCKNDQAAHAFIEVMAIKPIVNGLLNPDTDGIRGWAAQFGDHMIKKGFR